MAQDKFWLEPIINEALQKLYKNDNYLICNLDEQHSVNHVGERSIAFRFGVYLQEIAKNDEKLKLYNIDSEYDRCIYDLKKRTDEDKNARPDLIIHKRGNNDNNLLIIEREAYLSKKTKIDEDKEKLKSFFEGRYKYKNALLIKINKNEPKLIWIDKNG